MSRWVLVLALWWTAAAEDARQAQRAEVARVDAIKGALAEPCWAGGCASLDEALEADADGELGTVGVVIAWCADDFHWVGDVLRMVAACVEIKILRRVLASTSTPSTRLLLDGVAISAPHRSTEPARPCHRREMT